MRLTASVLDIANHAARARELGAPLRLIEPILAVIGEVTGERAPRPVADPIVGVREMVLIQPLYRQVFFERFGYDSPRYGRIRPHAMFRTSQHTHAGLMIATADFQRGRTEDPARVLAAVLDALPLSVYVVDRRLRVVAWNRYRETGPLGRPRSEVLGRSLEEVLSSEGFAAVLPSLLRVFESGVTLEETAETRQGERTFRTWRLPVLIGSRVTHVVSLYEDVTERRLLEEQLQS